MYVCTFTIGIIVRKFSPVSKKVMDGTEYNVLTAHCGNLQRRHKVWGPPPCESATLKLNLRTGRDRRSVLTRTPASDRCSKRIVSMQI